MILRILYSMPTFVHDWTIALFHRAVVKHACILCSREWYELINGCKSIRYGACEPCLIAAVNEHLVGQIDEAANMAKAAMRVLDDMEDPPEDVQDALRQALQCNRAWTHIHIAENCISEPRRTGVKP